MERPRRAAALVINPPSDEAFRLALEQAMDDGALDPDALTDALRSQYPRLVARRREISHEPHDVWYVYRDGSWRSDLTPNSARDDFRATSESLADDAVRVRNLEERSAGLMDDDPTLGDLAQQSDDLTRDMAAKSARQAGLLRESREQPNA